MKHASNEPLYLKIASDLRNNITIEKWKEGERIPTEIELCELFHVSRITIRKAIDELVRDNLLIRKKAKGTFVTANSQLKDNHFTLFKSFTNEMKEVGIDVETLKVNILVSYADPNISKYLNIKSGEKIIILKRLRGEKGKAFAFFITYIKFDDNMSLKSSDYYGSFYSYLNDLGIQIEQNQEVVEAILPNHEISTMLKISPKLPVLKRTRFARDLNKQFYEYTECYYIGSSYKYYLDFK